MVAIPSSYAGLFLFAPSPGQVFRFLERRQRPSGEARPSALLLSDAAGRPPQRLLLCAQEGGGREWLEEMGPIFVKVFPPRVTLLWRREEQWGFTVWEAGEVVDQGAGPLRDASRKLSLWERLPGGRRPDLPDVVWAKEKRLPLDRLQAPVIDYVTVAQLDQKDLLVENAPRLYRFPL